MSSVGWNIGFFTGRGANDDLSDDCNGALLRIYQPGEKQAELAESAEPDGLRRERKAALLHFIRGAACAQRASARCNPGDAVELRRAD